jgi:hypothetical protein
VTDLNTSGAVREMTLAELKRLDAGYRFTRDEGGTFPYRGEGAMPLNLVIMLCSVSYTAKLAYPQSY